MESLVVRPARPDDAADLAGNWIDGARHYAALDADAFQIPPAEGLVAWFVVRGAAATVTAGRCRLAGR